MATQSIQKVIKGYRSSSCIIQFASHFFLFSLFFIACSTYRGSYQIKPDAHQRRKRQQIDHGSFTGGFASDEFAQSLSKASYRRYNQDEIGHGLKIQVVK